jgi:ubiquinone/menaquinone biosynthesis C-methylase UbiE
MMDSLAEINAKTRRAYNLVARKYHELFHDEMNEKEYDRNLLDGFALRFGHDSLVCDAGCGPSAHIGRYVFDKGIPVVGVDISDRCIALARRHNPEMKLLRADMGRLPFADGTIDGLIAYYSLIDTPKKHIGLIFREFHRVLKHNGSLLVAVKAGASEGYLPDLLGIKTEIYFTLFTEEEIAGYYRQAGFQLEFFEKRDPYGFEIKAERIFAIGKKL